MYAPSKKRGEEEGGQKGRINEKRGHSQKRPFPEFRNELSEGSAADHFVISLFRGRSGVQTVVSYFEAAWENGWGGG